MWSLLFRTLHRLLYKLYITQLILQSLPLFIFLSFILSFVITLLQYSIMSLDKKQFWMLAMHCSIVLCTPPHPPLWSAPTLCFPSNYLYYPSNNAPCSILCLLLLALHCSSVATAAISHRDTCSIVPGSLLCLKAFLFQRLAEPCAVTMDGEGFEELLLG